MGATRGSILVMTKDIANVKATKRMLTCMICMKDLPVRNVIFAIKILKTRNGLALSQIHYIQYCHDRSLHPSINRHHSPLKIAHKRTFLIVSSS